MCVITCIPSLLFISISSLRLVFSSSTLPGILTVILFVCDYSVRQRKLTDPSISDSCLCVWPGLWQLRQRGVEQDRTGSGLPSLLYLSPPPTTYLFPSILPAYHYLHYYTLCLSPALSPWGRGNSSVSTRACSCFPQRMQACSRIPLMQRQNILILAWPSRPPGRYNPTSSTLSAYLSSPVLYYRLTPLPAILPHLSVPCLVDQLLANRALTPVAGLMPRHDNGILAA